MDRAAPMRCFEASWVELRDHKPGALWRGQPGDDGKRPIFVIAPDGHMVCLDTWTLSGEWPNLTARPSIVTLEKDGRTQSWHGWLTAGVLTSV